MKPTDLFSSRLAGIKRICCFSFPNCLLAFFALLALEIAAQAAACFETLVRVRAGGAGEARRGYLVGARDVVLDGGPLPAGRPILAAVRLAACAPPLSRYAFEVGAGGRLRGEVSTFLAE